MRVMKILLSATVLSAGSFSIAPRAAEAAPAVTGTSGCVLKPGRQPYQPAGSDGGSGGGGGNPGTPAIVPNCGGGNSGGYENPYQSGDFADTGSVNNAISNLQNQINTLSGAPKSVSSDGATIVGDGTAGNPIRLSDPIKNTINDHTNQINNINAVNNRQDATLTDHENRITANTNKNAEQDGRLNNIDAKNAQQDARLDNHENRITKNENDITDIKAVNDRQDKTLADHENRITKSESDIANIKTDVTDIKAVNARQDQTLANHENRITKTEGDVASIQDGAVFYNRDASGKKTGGVTLNDGTGNTVKLGNVAAGKDANDAVNLGQLTSALDGLGGGVKVNADGSIIGPKYKIGGVTYGNVGDALKATNDLSVQYVPDANGKPTNNIILAGDGTGQAVKISNVAAGTADTDAANVGQIKNNLAYDTNKDGTRSNSVTLHGGSSGPVLMRNVADGLVASDAATLGQLTRAKTESFRYTDSKFNELKDYTDNRLGNLSGEIRNVQAEARAGIASAMATAALRYDDRPGKGSIAGAMGGFKSSTSMAVGVGYTSEDGTVRLNAAVAHSFETSDTSWNAGASWTFN